MNSITKALVLLLVCATTAFAYRGGYKGWGYEVSKGYPIDTLYLVQDAFPEDLSTWTEVGGVSVAALDELLQGYIPGRNMDLFDWFADAAGVAVGVTLGVLTGLRARKRRALGGRSPA